ncbi:beta-lactamase family protein [Spirillospora sp. NBC_00431]
MTVEGTTDPGFEKVQDVFADNFEERDEVGAALCVYHRGRPVVDLWGGVADVDDDRPWDRDTLSVMDSTTKAITTVCALTLVEQGELDLDAPVARYWPEFAAHDKRDVTLRHVFTHQAGLPAVDRWISLDDVEAWAPCVEALEAQRPYWKPGTAHGYHGLTIGWLLGEPIRRVSGLTPGAFVREHIAPRLSTGAGLDLWIGLPEEEEHRVAPTVRVDLASPGGLGASTGDERYDEMYRQCTELYLDAEFLDQYMHPDKRTAAFFDRPLTIPQRAFGPTEVGKDMNSRRHHAMELPSATGIASARSLARLAAALVGEVDGVRLLGEDIVAEAATTFSSGPDQVVLTDTAWGLGFSVPGGVLFPGHGTGRGFGHAGANGTLLYADLDADLAIGYLRNHMTLDVPDPRSWPLVRAAYDCLESL